MDVYVGWLFLGVFGLFLFGTVVSPTICSFKSIRKLFKLDQKHIKAKESSASITVLGILGSIIVLMVINDVGFFFRNNRVLVTNVRTFGTILLIAFMLGICLAWAIYPTLKDFYS